VIRTIAVAAGLAFAATLPAISAHAAARDRVFVASYGSDSNPCTFGSPCKTFQNAVNVVADGGEVTAIDSAGFGPVTITSKSVTITSPAGVEAGITTPSGGNAITVNAGSTDTVSLRGLTLVGAGVGLYGISFNSGAKLEIIDCLIRDFRFDSAASGIIVQPTGSTQLTISKTFVLNNSNAGIYLTPTGTGGLNGTIDEVTADHNNYGMYIDSASTSGQLLFNINDSHADGNGLDGIVLNSGAGGANFGTVKNTTANGNVGGDGIHASGESTFALLTHSVFGLNGGSAVNVGAGSNIYSDGTNDNFVGAIAGVQSEPPF
jgi:hypothetical protein